MPRLLIGNIIYQLGVLTLVGDIRNKIWRMLLSPTMPQSTNKEACRQEFRCTLPLHKQYTPEVVLGHYKRFRKALQAQESRKERERALGASQAPIPRRARLSTNSLALILDKTRHNHSVLWLCAAHPRRRINKLKP